MQQLNGLFVFTVRDPMVRCECGAEAPFRDVLDAEGRVVDLIVYSCRDASCSASGVPSVRRLRQEAAR